MDRELLPAIIARYEEVTFSVNRRINALIRREVGEEITLDQYSILRYIRKHGRCTSSELSDIFCVGKSSITAIITRLFDKQLLLRTQDDKDRRVTYLALTPAGEKTSDELEARIQEALSRIMHHFDQEEAVRFVETFEKLAGVLTDLGEGVKE